jgi:DNA mismatch repair protein MutL
MGKINLLDSTIFNRIAAGEVVEKPASVVKELVENSLDAKATQIKIEVIDGGLTKIKVSDNGVGIHQDEVEKAFLPHATSKISKVDDLDKIGTLGFRGEALASIANVSKVQLISKTANNQTGKQVNIEGGEITKNEEVGCPVGTVVSVDNLFYNVPARKKFLRSSKRETTEITNLVARLILANPNVKFTYITNEKEVYRSTGESLEEAIFTVYGKKSLDNIIPFETTSGNIKLSGYLGKPSYAKSNRTYQTLIINGRYVVNSVISAATYSAYQNYLMKGKFPFFVINMNLPLDALDVNVHPNKLDVKFENSQTIYGIFYNAVTNALMNANNILKVESDNNNYTKDYSFSNKELEDAPTYKKNEGVSFNNQQVEKTDYVNLDNERATQAQVSKEEDEIENKRKVVSSFMNYASDEEKQGNSLKENISVLTSILNKELDKVQTKQPSNEQTSAFDNLIEDNSNINLVGKVFNTYLLVQKDQSLFVIDQHAAHERLLYDKFTKQVDENKITSQGLLVPHILNVNHLEEDFLTQHLQNLQKLGFDVEQFGNLSFKVSSIPSVLSGINLDNFFAEIFKNMQSFNKTKTSELIIDHLKQASCKAAIKAGNNLSKLEIDTLFNKMQQSNMTLLCPHGRPVVVEVTRKEMDKWFKRIL